MIQVIIKPDSIKSKYKKRCNKLKRQFTHWWWINKDAKWFLQTLKIIGWFLAVLLLYITITKALY